MCYITTTTVRGSDSVLVRVTARFVQCSPLIKILICFGYPFFLQQSNYGFQPTGPTDSILRPETLEQFFVNFLIWCVAFTTYVIATLLPIVVIIGNRTAAGGDLIDGQVVGVIAV